MERQFKASARYAMAFVRWTLTGALIGVLCGLVGAAFATAVDKATQVREANGWLL